MLPSLRNFAITFIVSAIVFGALAFLFTEFAMNSFGGGFVNAAAYASRGLPLFRGPHFFMAKPLSLSQVAEICATCRL